MYVLADVSSHNFWGWECFACTPFTGSGGCAALCFCVKTHIRFWLHFFVATGMQPEFVRSFVRCVRFHKSTESQPLIMFDRIIDTSKPTRMMPHRGAVRFGGNHFFKIPPQPHETIIN